MEEAGKLQDWEVLPNSDTPLSSAPNLLVNSKDFEGIDGDSEGVIRSDYFTLNSEKRYAKTIEEEEEEEDREKDSVDSDNPSWIDPNSDSRYGDEGKRKVGFEGIELRRRNSGEFWSDSGSDGSADRKFGEFEVKGDLGYGYDQKREVGIEGIGEIEGIEIGNEGFTEFWSDSGSDRMDFGEFEGFKGKRVMGSGDDVKEEVGFEGVGLRGKNSVEFSSDMGGDGSHLSEFVEGEVGNVDDGGEESDVGEKKRVVWWKLPLEILKFCAFRVRVCPVWSFSIAAAVMGFVLLGRKLYKMKRKARGISFNVSMEDKKVSQFMTRAARLNEAFSVVKRVPIIRASLPAAGGLTPWPVMGLI
ncbi:uncharacterized protein LOC143889404 [Tasmannia lanceolata]|uniref:uncharacterized protein LOC143889404 n=1 Tax=Tasmannia lanceolata TaxID=3420 RepID=UPI004063C732